MASLNKVQLIGNVGADPVIETKSNIKYIQFSIATNETYHDKKGEKKTVTDWHSVVAFGKAAELLEKFIKKGSLIYIEGKLRTKVYEAEEQKKYSTSIILKSFQLLEKLTDSKQQAVLEAYQGEDEEELPF